MERDQKDDPDQQIDARYAEQYRNELFHVDSNPRG